jgi:hypothetical protein
MIVAVVRFPLDRPPAPAEASELIEYFESPVTVEPDRIEVG